MTTSTMRPAAFTLIELLVVIAIIATMSGMVLAGLSSVTRAAKRNQTQGIIARVENAIRIFRTETGFYPKGAYAKPPVEFETAGFKKGLLKIDATNGLPKTDNDDVWAPLTTPSTGSPWAVGNGLYSRLGVAMNETEKAQAISNAYALADVELKRFYHIGNIMDFNSDGDIISDGTGTSLYKPGGWARGAWGGVAAGTPQFNWGYVDSAGPYVFGPYTLGEWELCTVFTHFRFPPKILSRPSNGSAWSGFVPGNETAVGTQKWFTTSARTITSLYLNYVQFARPRDAEDARKRALRDGTSAENISYDSAYDPATGLASGSVLVTPPPSITTTLNKPWHGDYLSGLEKRNHRDVDGDGEEDILDAYGNPLVYINEGLPAAKSIANPLLRVRDNPSITAVQGGIGYLDEAGCLLLYHPDPDLEDVKYINANSNFSWVTDKPNSRDVAVRSDAYDIAFYGTSNGTNWIWNKYGYSSKENGDPYSLAGTLIPSRTRLVLTNTAKRTPSPYYLLSQDGARLVEPFFDSDSVSGANANGIWDSGEIYIDRNHNNTYDTNIFANDIRVCAPEGKEREFELLSAGPDGLFHAWRSHAVNKDNIDATSKK